LVVELCVASTGVGEETPLVPWPAGALAPPEEEVPDVEPDEGVQPEGWLDLLDEPTVSRFRNAGSNCRRAVAVELAELPELACAFPAAGDTIDTFSVASKLLAAGLAVVLPLVADGMGGAAVVVIWGGWQPGEARRRRQANWSGRCVLRDFQEKAAWEILAGRGDAATHGGKLLLLVAAISTGSLHRMGNGADHAAW
jgi:hypothetical protein